ncbi:hypothetical protein ACDF64_00845 [Agromyces sp. MMS24-JH15]|uniref:hypothetical protein n=1 Tax=Agromyces sp. MMS24-JH15 TaxID=3243765 RepID=UPI003749119B
MTDAPPPSPSTDPGVPAGADADSVAAADAAAPSVRGRHRLTAALSGLAAAGLLAACVWGAITVFGPGDDLDEEPAVVATAVRHAPVLTALAGTRRHALAASEPLRAAVRDLDGFSDAALVAEARTAVETLDAALEADDPDAVADAADALEGLRADLVERFVVHAEGRLAGATAADPAVLQAAHDAAGAVRSASAAELSARFAPLRAAVEAAIASHDQRTAEEAARRAAAGGGSGGSGQAPGTDEWRRCHPLGIMYPGQDYQPCDADVVVTALGAHVDACPEGTLSHIADIMGFRSGAVTLDYPFPYFYTVEGGHNIAVFHCDSPAGFGTPHGREPVTG